ncbi:MAG: hypothetical protein GF405_05380 [Candidatus Eisenbacteria bacterium]|nr:hypothetical protein [Candidatus Eisenbacteria bacterium]
MFMLRIAVLVLAGAVAAPACAQVVINEFMPDPAVDWSPSDGNEEYHSVEDEWIEILNIGAGPIDITGWRLRDAVSDSSWRYEFSGSLAAGAYAVVYGNEAYDWEDQNGYPRYGLSLNNSGDTVALVRPDGTVVDAVTYDGSQVDDDRSIGRIPDGVGWWEVLDGLNPADPPISGIEPSPGDVNVASPVEPCGWGEIKALFR